MKVVDGEATDARNLALAQGAEAAWLIKQTAPGAETVDVMTTDGLEVRRLLVRWFAELSVSAAA